MSTFVIGIMCVCAGIVVGACVPAIYTWVNKEVVKVKADAAKVKADAEAIASQAKVDVAAAELRVANAYNAAKADVAADYQAVTARAESAEAFIAKYLPGQAAQPSVVPAPAPVADPPTASAVFPVTVTQP